MNSTELEEMFKQVGYDKLRIYLICLRQTTESWRSNLRVRLLLMKLKQLERVRVRRIKKGL
jgi:hypothetical protein